MKSYNKPTDEQLDRVMPLLSSPKHEAHFFARLENPNWISPLAKRGVFKHPPQNEVVPGGGVRFPNWPVLQYLARVASLAPTEVASVLKTIETDNPSVIGDIARAAIAMPAGVASCLTSVLKNAARQRHLWIHFKDVGDFCVHLSQGGEYDSALELADALFTPRFEAGSDEPSNRDEYWYKECLSKLIPLLAPARPQAFLPKLCNWLKAAVDAKRHLRTDSDNDFSFSWRPAIEDHSQNRDHGFAGTMVGCLRSGLELAVSNGSLSLDEAFAIVDRYAYLIFRRIKLHLIGEFASQNRDSACQTILNRGLFDDYKFKHEYSTLVGRRLDLLSSSQRDEWFGWIDAGPDMTHFDQSIKDNLGRDATEDDRHGRIRYWQFDKLHWVRAHLDGKRREFYEKMLDEYGDPDLAEFNVKVGASHWGNKSPRTVEQLAEFDFATVVEQVSSWRPEVPDFRGPSIEGLSDTFEQYVATNPVEFSTKALVLRNRPAIFVRRFIAKMTEAVERGKEIDVSAIIELCNWIVARPVDEATIPRSEYDELVDSDWQWARGAICQFVESVCKARSDAVPKYSLVELREPLWGLLEQLCQDSSDSNIFHDPSEVDPRDRDFLDLAINSPRGKAVEVALEYTRWVGNHVKEMRGDREVIAGGFDVMPEVRRMLEWQIAHQNRSFTGLAAIGSKLGLICWVDKEWLRTSAGEIFSLHDIEENKAGAHGWAAWNAFLVWVHPHHEFYQVFESQFAYAVEQSASIESTERSSERPMHHLGEHLMVLYGRGHLSLDEGGLLRRFLEIANADVRRHAISFVGQSLDGAATVPSAIVLRFEKLWDFYWANQGKEDTEKCPGPWLFGTWFSSGKFTAEWALDRLLQFVEVSATPQPDHVIADKLAELADVDLAKSTQILDKMIRGDKEGWRIHSWESGAMRILALALGAQGETQRIAAKLINYLGRRGYGQFGQLLTPRQVSE